jgi:transposase
VSARADPPTSWLPFETLAGPHHPIAAYVYAEDRKGIRPADHLAEVRGLLRVDGYSEFKRLTGDRADGSVTLAFCWARLPKVLRA